MTSETPAIDPADLAVRGLKIGRYMLLRRLAIGGMAELFLAESRGVEGFAKVVVLKRILPQLASNTQFVRMFLHEAKLVAQLSHPNIAQVYDIGQSGENYFFAMEYVHGEDLRHLLNRAYRVERGLPIEHAVSIGIGMAAGLHHAHEHVDEFGKSRDIVHRDVTPSNVMVSYTGHVKLLDFGVAKAERSGISTARDQVKGSIAYMSPEQCRGDRLDRRSDVFAAGILLYEATTSSRLFKADDEVGLMKQIEACVVPPPSTRRSNYPAALERIVLKALARDRDDRYATAQELQLELEAYARTDGLVISTVSLASYMEQLFGDKIRAWQKAQRKGQSFGAHLRDTLIIKAQDIEFLDPDELVDEPEQATSADTPSAKGLPSRMRNRRALAAIVGGGVIAGALIAATATRGGTDDTPPAAYVLDPTKPNTDRVTPNNTESKPDDIKPAGASTGTGTDTAPDTESSSDTAEPKTSTDSKPVVGAKTRPTAKPGRSTGRPPKQQPPKLPANGSGAPTELFPRKKPK